MKYEWIRIQEKSPEELVADVLCDTEKILQVEELSVQCMVEMKKEFQLDVYYDKTLYLQTMVKDGYRYKFPNPLRLDIRKIHCKTWRPAQVLLFGYWRPDGL